MLLVLRPFIAGGHAKGVFNSSVKFGQRSENVYSLETCWN